MRANTLIFAKGGDSPIGTVTSGAFGPTLGAPMSMGYVNSEHAAPGTALEGEVRGKRMPVTVAPLPFVAANFKR